MKTKKQNLLIFSWRGPKHPHEGGAEIVTHEYAKGWVKAGYNVTLFTSAFPNSKSEEVLDGVRIIRSGNQILSVHLKAFVWYLFRNKTTFDLVIDQFHGIPFFTPFYIRTKKIAFIHEVTKDVWDLNPLPKPINYIPMYIGKTFEPFLFKVLYRNIKFITVSNSTRSELIEWGISKQNVLVIQNGVKIQKVKMISKEKKPTVTFLGALAKDKGIEDAIEAFSLIKKKIKNSQMWVIGKCDESYLAFLKQKIIQSDLSISIKFFGFISELKKFELLKRSHIVLNPSVREGWGLTVIEAAAMGTPTIGYNSPGLRDSIQDKLTGYLTKRNDPSNLSELAIGLLENKNHYRQLARGCLKYSKQFQWENSINKSLKFIKELLDLKQIKQ